MIGTNERSLDGGLRYSLEGGSFEAYRDSFQWSTLPSVAEFQTAVEQAFAAWTAVDPVSGLHTDLTFIADFATAVVGTETFTGFDINGAEIDLLAADSGETQHACGELASARSVTPQRSQPVPPTIRAPQYSRVSTSR